MKIGDLARTSQTPVETIRFYEREGLLPPAPRSEGNYRVYTAQQAEQLAFVRHCRSLDMSLQEVRVLLKLRSQPDAACDEVNALLDAHIGHVAQRIRSLRLLERQLKALRRAAPNHIRRRRAASWMGWLGRAVRLRRTARTREAGM